MFIGGISAKGVSLPRGCLCPWGFVSGGSCPWALCLCPGGTHSTGIHSCSASVFVLFLPHDKEHSTEIILMPKCY